MTPPEPRADLHKYAQAAWRNLHASAVAAGVWEPTFVLGLEAASRMASQYVQVAARNVANTSVEVAAMRELTRSLMYDWHYLAREERSPPLRADGIDPDAARLCGIPDEGRAIN